MGKRKPKPIPEARCCYCEHFFHSNPTKNNQVHNPRMCREENRETLSVDVVCENFQMAKFFFCDNTNHQISLAVCHRRVEKRMDECRKCKQRGEILVAEALSGAVVPRKPVRRLKQRVHRFTGNSTIKPPASEPPEHPEPRRVLKRRIAVNQ